MNLVALDAGGASRPGAPGFPTLVPDQRGGSRVTNHLYYGDNLDVMPRYLDDESVDLVYLDPPFNSQADYNVLFAEQDGTRAAAQIKAFEDTWRWDQAAAEAYQEVVEAGGEPSRALQAMRTYLGENNLLAYLAMMAPRLVELRRVLKPTGSIYLHCDPTASHYLKMLMDSVFGASNFRNEIIWHYKTFHGVVKTYWPKKHDTLLFYTKTDDWKFHQLFDDDIEDTIDFKRWRKYLVNGNEIRGSNMPTQDSRFMRYHRRFVREEGREPEADDVVFRVAGQPIDTVWDIKAVDPKDRDRLYPTQKPVDLLRRIIEASTDPGDVVLDPFCGCGTSIEAASQLGRRWIGIDITHLAINLMKHRLQVRFGEDIKTTYGVKGEPVTLSGAAQLAEEDPYQFQWWALGLVGARPAEGKKGADRGIDGRLYFHDDRDGETKQVIFSVKAGKTGVAHVRDLLGVVGREGADIGVFISMQPPTGPMRREAATGEVYESPWGKHPRIQLLTIEDLLEGGRVDMPPLGLSKTLRKGRRYEAPGAAQTSIPID